MHRLSVLSRSALLVCVVTASSLATAQGRTAPTSPCTETVVRDTTSPVWREIWTQYGRIDQAVRQKDTATLRSLIAPDYHAVVPNGEVWDEHWTRFPDSWKRGKVENVRGGTVFIDGKRVNVGVGLPPYDPEAPPYDPHDPRPKRPVADTLLQIVTTQGIVPAIQTYPALTRSPYFLVTEVQLNTLGYRLLGLKRVPEAIEVLKLNVTAYPHSANVDDSLGEAHLAHGDREEAIRSYRGSLELNPQNANAVEKLRTLEKR